MSNKIFYITNILGEDYLCTKNINIGDKIYGVINNRLCSGIVKDDSIFYYEIDSSFTGVRIHKLESFKIIGKLIKFDIKEGDFVVIEYTDGYNPTGDLDIGILTRKWNDDPYCEIDDKKIDLASEGHSSNVYKLNFI